MSGYAKRVGRGCWLISALVMVVVCIGGMWGCRADVPEIRGSEDAVKYYSQRRDEMKSVSNWASAEIAGEKAVIAAERAYGIGDIKVADHLVALGAIYATDGLYPRAEYCFRRGLDIQEDAMGSGHLQVADTMMQMGEFYTAVGKYEEAEPMFIRSIAIREGRLGVNDPKVAESRCAMAAMYFRRGMYDEAEIEANQALEICEVAMQEGRLDVVQSIGYLMKLFRQMDNSDKMNLVGKLMGRFE